MSEVCLFQVKNRKWAWQICPKSHVKIMIFIVKSSLGTWWFHRSKTTDPHSSSTSCSFSRGGWTRRRMQCRWGGGELGIWKKNWIIIKPRCRICRLGSLISTFYGTLCIVAPTNGDGGRFVRQVLCVRFNNMNKVNKQRKIKAKALNINGLWYTCLLMILWILWKLFFPGILLH